MVWTEQAPSCADVNISRRFEEGTTLRGCSSPAIIVIICITHKKPSSKTKSLYFNLQWPSESLLVSNLALWFCNCRRVEIISEYAGSVANSTSQSESGGFCIAAIIFVANFWGVYVWWTQPARECIRYYIRLPTCAHLKISPQPLLPNLYFAA